MRTIIAGSRDITDPAVLDAAMQACGWIPSVVISGAARGVDQMGETWAAARGIPVDRFPADWARHGKAAGPVRNAAMQAAAEALVAVPGPDSRGTWDMVRRMERAGKRVFVWRGGD